jgi:hypothetical protein
MSSPTASTLAPRVEAAKRLLRELERHASSAVDTLNTGDAARFLAVIDERESLIARLSQAVDVLNHERASTDLRGGRDKAETEALFGELARVAASVLASHERLVASTAVERDRLEAAVRRADKPDAVANQYAAMSQLKHGGTLSVTG